MLFLLFGEHFVKTGIFESAYAKMLSQAFDSRLDSDYDIVYIPECATVEAIQQDAQQFVAKIEAYLQQVGAL